MALLLILMALFGLVFGGFSSSMGHSSSPQTFRPSPGTTHVQKSVTRSHVTTRTHVTVRAHVTARSSHATAKSSVSCSASVKIKGASTQTSRTCRYSPVAP
jgi:hypothetical protein